MIREGMTLMQEDPRMIRSVFNTLWAIKTLERIDDHATNIGENVVYFAEGKDVRRLAPDAVVHEISRRRR